MRVGWVCLPLRDAFWVWHAEGERELVAPVASQEVVGGWAVRDGG